MFSITYLCICVYCMLQLGFLLSANNRQQRSHLIKNRYFSRMLIIVLLSFTADIISSCYQGPVWIFPFAVAGTYVEIILNTMLLPVYFLYVCAQISNIDSRLKRRTLTVLCVLAVLCAVIVISTFFSGKVFYFDVARNYHRGELFWLPMTVLFIMMLVIEGFIIYQKAEIEASYFISLVLFLVFPLVGWGFQWMIYGLPFSLVSVTFAAQVVFTNIQNRSMDTDYLTGVFNRHALDCRMQSKIDSTTNNKSFSAILVDIDDFKAINDGCGHNEGDRALVRATQILRLSVGRNAFIARYGGDEFCVIFDEDDAGWLETIVHHIYSKLQEFNENTKKAYKLSFSIGYAVYDTSMGNSNELFLKIIDQKMYADKKRRKAGDK